MSKETLSFVTPPAEKLQNFFGVFLQFQIGVDTNGKIEELDTRRQGLIKEIAALNAESVSPQKIEFLSAHLGNWDNIDFEDRRQVADIILSQVHATADRVSFEWKI